MHLNTSSGPNLTSRAMDLIPRIASETGIDLTSFVSDIQYRTSQLKMDDLSRADKSCIASRIETIAKRYGFETPSVVRSYLKSNRWSEGEDESQVREDVKSALSSVEVKGKEFEGMGGNLSQGLRDDLSRVMSDACSEMFEERSKASRKSSDWNDHSSRYTSSPSASSYDTYSSERSYGPGRHGKLGHSGHTPKPTDWSNYSPEPGYSDSSTCITTTSSQTDPSSHDPRASPSYSHRSRASISAY
ncbi:hypothetical protein IAR55_002718 [Kwoniella newhampshirensis]|uniref:Uncharacterized protein n=1 Tax=Kwoniella newhampshirensis TaxID=1651941 RepID=A0AAW0YNR3_9TREE